MLINAQAGVRSEWINKYRKQSTLCLLRLVFEFNQIVTPSRNSDKN